MVIGSFENKDLLLKSLSTKKRTCGAKNEFLGFAEIKKQQTFALFFTILLDLTSMMLFLCRT